MEKLSNYERFIRDVAVPIMQSCNSINLHNLIAGKADKTNPISARQMNLLLGKIRRDIEDFDKSEMGFVNSPQVIAMIQVIGSSIKRGLNSTIVVICDETYNKNRMMSKILDLNGFDCVLEGDKISYKGKFTFLFVPSFDKLNLKETSVDYFIIDNSAERKDLDKIKESITEYSKTHTVKTIIYEV